MERIQFINHSKKIKVYAILFAVIVISSGYLHLIKFAAAAPSVNGFYCDALNTGEINGHQKYKADVDELIHFYFDVTEADDASATMGDGTIKINLTGTGSPFSYSYRLEGSYNVSLNAWKSGAINDSDWILIEIINDPPQFEIVTSNVDYYEATYSFEEDRLGRAPSGWLAANNFSDFYIINDPYDPDLFLCHEVSGSYQDLGVEDNISWVIGWDSNPYTNPEIYFEIMNGNGIENGFTPGLYQLYFSANASISLYNAFDSGPLFVGQYCNGLLVEINWRSDINYTYMYFQKDKNEWRDPPIAIDWFKLVRVDKGVNVVNDIEDHGRIVQIGFGGQSNYCEMKNIFSSQSYGTIELWYKTTDANHGGILSLGNNFGLSQTQGNWFIGTTNISSQVNCRPINGKWYHVRFDFRDLNTISYQNLSLGFFRVSINGASSNEFPMGTGGIGINEFKIVTNGTVYIDAVGYSWQNYEVGENLNVVRRYYTEQEIVFNAINLEESAIDLEGFNNYSKEIKNNYQYIWDFGDGTVLYDKSPTYKFINPGTYPVRLTLIDDQGAITTNVKQISVENREPSISIGFGQNYGSTYDFKNDLNGDAPSDWYTHGNVKVIDSKEGFSKVVEIDNREGSLGIMSINEKISNYEVGYHQSIEFWICFTDTSKDKIDFWIEDSYSSGAWPDSSHMSIGFGFSGGLWKYYDKDKYPAGFYTISYLPIPENNEWMHIRLEITFTTWRLYVNDNVSVYYNAMSSNNKRLVIYSEANSHIFLDSFGFTSDPSYNLGDNNLVETKNYHSTWDFGNIPDGDVPFDYTLQLSALGPWIFTSNNFGQLAEGCSVRIIPELDGHYKVLELHDDNTHDIVQASLMDFSKPTYGTIEFWLRTNDISQGLLLAFGYEVFDSGIWLGNDGNWWYMNRQDKIRISDVPPMRSETWHHIRIDFDCRNSGGYLGLGGDQFYFWVDGNISHSGQPFNFDHDVVNFKWNIWSSTKEGFNHSIYLDAVGVSWDPAYNVGDNRLPTPCVYTGTEIIFSAKSPEASSYTESMRYYWDFGDNQTATGQTVLHTYPTPGQYKIQVTAIDSNGDSDYSEDYIYIENYYPEVEIDKKYYFGNASYDFDHDKLGQCPSGWNTHASSWGYAHMPESATLITGMAGFRNVVEMEALQHNYFSYKIQTPYLVSNGTYEMWIYVTDVKMTSVGVIIGGSWGQFSLNYLNTAIPRAFDNRYSFESDFWINDTIITFEDNWQLQPNKWTHLRVDFCADDTGYMGLDADTYIIYLDGHASQVLPLGDPAEPGPDWIDEITICSAYEFSPCGTWKNNWIGGKVYIDNVGFSWDPTYTVGGNRYSNGAIQFNEGDTVILGCDSYDTSIDYDQLIYNWGPPSINVEQFEDLGWRYSHNFMDDDSAGMDASSLICFVADPLHAWDIFSYPIQINNVLPSLSIHSPSIRANLSVAIFNSGTEGANFSVNLISDCENRTYNPLFPSGFTENWLNLTLSSLDLDISHDWSIIVNQTWRDAGQHLFMLKFLFENGREITRSFNFNGSTSSWELNLNDLWLNSSKSLTMVPLEFTASICDPSNDQITLSVNYTIKSVFLINFMGTPFTDYYTSPNIPEDILCELKVYEANGNKYAQVNFIEKVKDSWDEKLRSGTFPVSYDFDFDVDMTDLDIDQIINEIFTVEGIHPLTPDFQRNYFLDATYQEFNPSCKLQNLTVAYNISTSFEFGNLAPSVQIKSPYNITEDQSYCYQAEVQDFNQDNLSVEFYFGINDGETGQIKYNGLSLGNNTYGINYTYTNAGVYLITVIASDGILQSKSIQQIRVENLPPQAKLKIPKNTTIEGEPISFEVDLFDSDSDLNSLRYYWDFGDGGYSTELNPSHYYSNSGEYVMTFNVKDDNGATFSIQQNITVINAPPEILGPFSFTAIEGESFLFDVDVLEGPKDFLMNYTWDIYKAKQIFNGTYNFMEINDGEIPGSPFSNFTPGLDISYQVINNLSGHVKVLELVDNNNETHGEWSLTYGNNQSRNGTIEFWLRTSYLSQNETNFYINLLESDVGVIPIAISDNGTWRYNNIYGSNWTEIMNLPIFTSKNWHHIRIDYACANASYNGLSANQWRIIVDGVSSPTLNFQYGMAPFNNTSFLDTLQISSTNHSKISIYCDAIGYFEGSSQYQIGGNINPVLISQDYIQTIYGERPSVVFNEGTYFINLTVQNDLTTYAEFILEVINIAPVVSVSSKVFYGTPGYINITAYAWDSFVDSDILEFEWFVGGKRTQIETGALYSTLSVFCDASGILKGHVNVRDNSDLSSTAEFFIRVFIDSDGDGLTNEFEYLNNFTTTDQDGDNLPNSYEVLIFGTNATNPDTDDDGLLDGWDNQTQIGEWFIGTDPTNNDTDGDNLLDGTEFFGWNVSLYVENKLTTYHYSSDPLCPDTDNDGVPDEVEYNYKTNPRSSDTDNDYLTDYKEIYVTGTNPLYADMDEDGLWDGLEIKIGTHYDKADTDGDGIQDSLEYYGFLGHKTNPLCQDTDHDFLSDSAEIIPLTVKINGRMSVKKAVELEFPSDFRKASEANIAFLLAYSETALPESMADVNVRLTRMDCNLVLFSKDYKMNVTNRYIAETINLKEIIEENQKSYAGTYTLKVTYLNTTHSDLCLEEYRLDVTRYLNPNKDDFDNDGILDGVETQLLVRRTNIVTEYEDLPNITADTNPDTHSIYSLEISDIGRMFDADIEFSIKSNATLIGNGSVCVEVIKRELDFRKNDLVLSHTNLTFSTNDNFSHSYPIDLSSYFPDNYYGTYDIYIDIYGNTSDIFTLTNILIRTNGYKIANNTDTEAWITRPDKWDTDDDGWSDKYEIYNRPEPTNPLAWDTDGDGIKDSKDLDPLHDLVIEIECVKAQIYDLPLWYLLSTNPPYLQMTVSFTDQGTYKTLPSFQTKCTQDTKSYKFWFLGIPGTFEVLPRIHYYSTAIFPNRYCVDVNDEKNTAIKFSFETWDNGIGRIDQYWDTRLIGKVVNYAIKDHPMDVPFNVNASYNGCYLEATITLRALSRANTIAIYDNSTKFNGHYNDEDRIHIYQINLDEDGSTSPFVEGLNFILIPNKLFIRTELNSIMLNNTKLTNSVLKNGEFISLDHDNLPKQASNIIETYFNITCSLAVALQILDFIQTGILNETTSETGIINQFASTKIDGFRAEMMNLHPHILDIITVVNPYVSSRTGSIPKTCGEWWADLFKAIDEALKSIVTAIVNVIVKIVKLVVNAAIALIGLIVKGIILVLVYITFAITLVLTALIFLAFIPIVAIYCGFNKLKSDIKATSFTIYGNKGFSHGYYADWVYSDFLGLKIPCVVTYYDLDGTKFENKLHFFSTNLPMPPVGFYENINGTGTRIAVGTEDDFYQGTSDMMKTYGLIMAITGPVILIGTKTGTFGILASVAGIATTFILLTKLLSDIIYKEAIQGKVTQKYIYGTLIGGIIVAICNFILIKFAGSLNKLSDKLEPLSNVKTIFEVLAFFGILAWTEDLSADKLFADSNTCLGLFALGAGVSAMLAGMKKEETKQITTNFAYLFAISAMVIPLIMFMTVCVS